MSTSNKISRRGFLSGIGVGTCGAALHTAGYGGSGMMAYGMPNMFGALTPNQSVFILVNFSGGCSYNIAPIFHGAYRDRNPTISYGADTSLPVSLEQGLHPSLTYLKTLFDEGSLALFNEVGVPNQSRSHDEATVQWHRGYPMGGNSEGGWAARLTSQAASIFAGISLGGTNELIRGGTNPPRSFGDLNNFGEDRFKWSDERTEWLRITRENLIAQSSTAASGNVDFIRNSMNNVERSVKIIQEETARPLPTIANPFINQGFSNACRDAAKLIAAPSLGVRFIYLQMGGFDTHSGERARLTDLLDDVNSGLRSLVQTVQALGRWNDVMVATMSEFCRTFENGSQGTDHGEEAPLMLMGGSVAGRVVNAAPTAAKIQASGSFLYGYAVDFRQIYKEVVAQMGFDAEAIFPASSFTPLGLFK